MNMKIEEHKTKGNIIGTISKDDDCHSTVSQVKEDGLPNQYEE